MKLPARAAITAVVGLSLLSGLPASAHARHHHRHHGHSYTQSYREGRREARWHRGYIRRPWGERHAYGPRYASAGTILPHPAGCPGTAFCGCAASIEAFGHSVRELWLAANWLTFPRAVPAPGMAAVFGRHHVAIIREVYGDGTALLYDGNSGHHLTRLHRRSIAGATIVNPHGGRQHYAEHRRRYARS